MKHLKKFNEDISDHLDGDNIKDLFQDLEIDFNVGVDVNLDEDEFSKFARITIKFYDNKSPEDFGSNLLKYIERSEEIYPSLSFESMEIRGRYVVDGLVCNKSDIVRFIDGGQWTHPPESRISKLSSLEIILSDQRTSPK